MHAPWIEPPRTPHRFSPPTTPVPHPRVSPRTVDASYSQFLAASFFKSVRRSDEFPQAKPNNKKAKSSSTTPRKASSAWTEVETSALAAGVAKHGAGTYRLTGAVPPTATTPILNSVLKYFQEFCYLRNACVREN